MKNDVLIGVNGRPLWEGHRGRMRSRIAQVGWESLKPYEMVEVILYHVIPRRDVSAVSRLLVDRFGSVGGVFFASREELETVPGVTPHMAEWISLTGELVLTYSKMHNRNNIRLSCFKQVSAFLKRRVGEMDRSDLWLLYTDFNYNLLTINELKKGKTWWTADSARRMVMDAIGHGARFVYMVLWRDNPSQAMNERDNARLNGITAVMCAAELELLDCLLVNENEIYSMRLNNHMKEYRTISTGDVLREQYGAGGE